MTPLSTFLKTDNEPQNYEIKFVITEDQAPVIRNWLNRFGVRDTHAGGDGLYTTCTSYLAEWKRGKQHGKIRLRRYVKSSQDAIFIEEKIKSNCRVKKARKQISEAVAREIETHGFKQIKEYGFSPVALKPLNTTVTYTREAWTVQIGDGVYRATFDYDLAAGKKKLLPGRIVFELKGAEIHNELAVLLKEHNICPQNGFSKYRLARLVA